MRQEDSTDATLASGDGAEPGSTAPLEDSSAKESETGGHVTPVTIDGGLSGWMTVSGSWLFLFSTLGYVYSFGVYQDYYTRIFLTTETPSSIAWMGSFQLALPFAGGFIAGKFFDAGYIRSVMAVGSVIFTFSLFMLSLTHRDHYYEVFLSQGVGTGIGAGLIFAPSTNIISLHFKRRRSLAYGVALTGNSLGAVIFPIMLNHLIPRIGFSKAVRATAYIVLGCLVVGNLLIRLPAGYHTRTRVPPPLIRKFFRDPPYVLFVLGSMIALLGAYFPVVYLQLYSIEHDVDNNLAFYSLAIMNGASVVGRIVGNHLADVYGVWNIQVPTTLFTGAMIWAIYGIDSAASLIVVSILYGIFSGAWLSLTMAGLPSLASSPQEVGGRVGVALALVSLGLLVSAPAQGALLTSNFIWIRPIAFSGSAMFVSTGIYAVMRMLVAKRKGSQRV